MNGGEFGECQTYQTLIALELFKAVRKLGAKSDLLGIVGSYGDTLSGEDLLHVPSGMERHTPW